MTNTPIIVITNKNIPVPIPIAVVVPNCFDSPVFSPDDKADVNDNRLNPACS